MGERVTEELLVFDHQPYQTVVESSEMVEISPINSIQNNNIIEFRDHGVPGVFKALDKIFLHAEFQILKKDLKPYTTEDQKQPYMANNSLFSLIKSASIALNNVIIANHNETFAQKDFIEASLNYDSITVKNRLNFQGLFNTSDEESLKASTKNSKIIEYYGKFNVLNVGKWLIPNIDILVKLILHHQNFFMIEQVDGETKTSSFFKLINLTLFIKYIKVKENFNYQLEQQLANGYLATYEYKGGCVYRYSIPKESTTYICPALYQGRKPSIVLMAFLKTEIFDGKDDENPHQYSMDTLEEFTFIMNGTNFYKNPLKFKNTEQEQKIAKLFAKLHQAINIDTENMSCLVNSENFHNICFYIAEDLTSCQYGLADLIEPVVNVSLGFRATFSKPTKDPITALMYILKPQKFTISAARVVENVEV